jgi:hypothetical protein
MIRTNRSSLYLATVVAVILMLGANPVAATDAAVQRAEEFMFLASVRHKIEAIIDKAEGPNIEQAINDLDFLRDSIPARYKAVDADLKQLRLSMVITKAMRSARFQELCRQYGLDPEVTTIFEITCRMNGLDPETTTMEEIEKIICGRPKATEPSLSESEIFCDGAN